MATEQQPKLKPLKMDNSISDARSINLEEITLDEINDILDETIVEDRTSKLIVWLSLILNYTEEDQQNVGFNSGTSTGKSYIALDEAELCPEEDLMKIVYASGKAFYHDSGEMTTPDGEPVVPRDDFVSEEMKSWDKHNPKPEKGDGIDNWKTEKADTIRRLKKEWDKIDKVITVDLERKIIIFIDMPHDNLLQNLRSILSHDQKVSQISITDKDSSGGNKTKHVRILGYPTVFFLSANFSQDEQERNRMFLLSAETSQEKLLGSIKMAGEAKADRQAWKQKKENSEGRASLRHRLAMVKDAGIKDIIISPEIMDDIVSDYTVGRTRLVPRNMRDFPRMLALIKAHALMNLWNRKIEDDCIYAIATDVTAGRDLYNKIRHSNELGIPPAMYDFYETVLRPRLMTEDGITRTEMGNLWLENFNERLSYKRKVAMVHLLSNVGLIEEKMDEYDRRNKLIVLPGQMSLEEYDL